MEFVIANKEKYDSFIFGASTVGVIDPSAIPFGRFYNMYYSVGAPLEFLNDLRILLKEGVKIKYLMIGLDDFSYKIDPKGHLSELMRHPYEDSKLKRALFLLKYLFSPVSAQREAYLKAFFGNGKTGFIYNISSKGDTIWQERDKLIKADKNYFQGEYFSQPFNYNDTGRIDKTLVELKAIVDIAKANNIKLVIFINPIHYLRYVNIDLDRFSDFKRGLAQITDYYDFSGLNSVVKDNHYFYETSHYRPMLGDTIISKILNVNISQAVSDFGVFITKDNVEEHILSQKKEIKAEKNHNVFR
ncbi:MAG: hypothetical protein WC417_00155 [Candidatus Omnitrophota bacterium]|jgi:hypothetical protein